MGMMGLEALSDSHPVRNTSGRRKSKATEIRIFFFISPLLVIYLTISLIIATSSEKPKLTLSSKEQDACQLSLWLINRLKSKLYIV
jgi:hypothetical protein